MRASLVLTLPAIAVALVMACSADPAANGSSSGGPGGGSSGAPTPPDGVKNGTETDVDCGGSSGRKCATGKNCKTGDDCESALCNTTCQAPSPTDGVKNGNETDVDCGGDSGKKCDVGKACKAHADCTSDGCDFAGKCAVARSCTAEAGGATCGEGAVTAGNKRHETCCKSIEVPRPAGQGGPYFLDKYLITAGRLRAFVDRTQGNLRAFTQTLPEGGFIGWKRAWDQFIPQSMDEVHFVLGPGGDRAGCDLNASKARTYWMPDAVNEQLGDGKHPPDAQATLDAKVLNCAPVWVFYALCAWDGARLPSAAEVLFAWQAGEGRPMPWGNAPNDETRSADKEVHDFPPGFPLNWVNVPEPGRYPAGYGKWGHADLVGATFHYTRDINGANTQVARVNSGSWESAHQISATSSNINTTRAYWAFGGRCSRPAAN